MVILTKDELYLHKEELGKQIYRVIKFTRVMSLMFSNFSSSTIIIYILFSRIKKSKVIKCNYSYLTSTTVSLLQILLHPILDILGQREIITPQGFIWKASTENTSGAELNFPPYC